jgi:hypothetical protein
MNLIAMGIFAMLFLAFMAIIGNSSATSIGNIMDQFDRINCPMPESSGLWNNTGTIMRTGQTYNYANVSSPVETLTCTDVHTPDTFDYCYGCPSVPFAGYMIYGSDWISELMGNKGGALLTLAYFFLTPANFNILGYTIADIGGIALMGMIALYAICYIFIGLMVYKGLSPFSGV